MSRIHESNKRDKIEEIEWVCTACGWSNPDYRGTRGTCDDCGETLTAEVTYE